jgi:protein-L-isoaspartate O-methyltransferase
VNYRNNSNAQFPIEKTIVRMTWEQHYLEALIDHLNPAGEVLEIGFALGYSSAHIQTFLPKHHTIIEPDLEIAVKASKWAGHNPAITVIHDTWENALPRLGIFDTVFFNDIDLELEAQKAQILDTGNMIIKKGQELIAHVKMQLPQIINIKYTDFELDAFFSQVRQFQPPEMANFLHTHSNDYRKNH